MNLFSVDSNFCVLGFNNGSSLLSLTFVVIILYTIVKNSSLLQLFRGAANRGGRLARRDHSELPFVDSTRPSRQESC